METMQNHIRQDIERTELKINLLKEFSAAICNSRPANFEEGIILNESILNSISKNVLIKEMIREYRKALKEMLIQDE